jgi:hypothetical protein
MAERRRPGQPASAEPLSISLVRDHRVNDLVFGHVGRLTYVSADENDDSRDAEVDAEHGKARIGKLLANRFPGSGRLRYDDCVLCVSLYWKGCSSTYSLYFPRSRTLPRVVSSNITGHLWRSDGAPGVHEQASR